MSSPPFPITHVQIAGLSPEFQALLRAVKDYYEARVAVLQVEVAALRAETITLRTELAGLRKTPQHPSLPPSTQHPHAKPPAKKPKSKRKHPGHPGHAKHERPLLPTDECDDIEICKPPECRRCGTKLTGRDTEPSC